jgi:hypothetical protein
MIEVAMTNAKNLIVRDTEVFAGIGATPLRVEIYFTAIRGPAEAGFLIGTSYTSGLLPSFCCRIVGGPYF